MVKRNPMGKVPDRIADHYKKNLEAAKTSGIVPFGKEQVTPKEFRARFATMSPAQRQQILDQHGQEEVLRQFRGR